MSATAWLVLIVVTALIPLLVWKFSTFRLKIVAHCVRPTESTPVADIVPAFATPREEAIKDKKIENVPVAPKEAKPFQF